MYSRTIVTEKLGRCLWLYNDPAFFNPQHPYHQSVLKDLLNELKEVLMQARKWGWEVNFTDGVKVARKPVINNVTDLIRAFRNATLHEDSPLRRYGSVTATFNYYLYYDEQNRVEDIALEMGQHHLYFRKHILKTLQKLVHYHEVGNENTPL